MGGGGATEGTRNWDLGPPPWVRGSINKKKVIQTRVEIHTQRPQYAKKFCPPTPPKWGTWVRGRRGFKIQKIIGVSFSVLK